MSRPAVFFDRDGVVNISPGTGYVLSWEQFEFSPGIVDALRVCKARGYATVVVTSQQGVGKGLMTPAALEDIHSRMQAALAVRGIAFDAIHACTCLADDPHCTCRKPSPEMILGARDQLDLDLTRSWLVGDHDRDIQMALNAGVSRTVRILNDGRPATVAATVTLANAAELTELLERVL
ncbi:MAG: HAD family hydrolase [Verrucomicrobiaceae bacterium]|nr:HAD family hydrolase [Verrucomicrobiaceae bacterium]